MFLCLFVCLSIYLSIYLSTYVCRVCVHQWYAGVTCHILWCWAGCPQLLSWARPLEVEQSSTSSHFMEDLESMTCFNQACSVCDTWNAWLVDFSLSLSPYGCYKDSGLETVLVPSNIARLSLILISVLLDSWCVCHDVPSFMTNKETAGSFPRSTTLITCRIIPLNKRSISRVSKSPQT